MVGAAAVSAPACPSPRRVTAPDVADRAGRAERRLCAPLPGVTSRRMGAQNWHSGMFHGCQGPAADAGTFAASRRRSLTPLPDGLADAYGRARLYRVGLVVFVAASISGGLAVGGPADRLAGGAGDRSGPAGARGPVLAGHLLASALLTATRQCGSARGIAIVSATLVASVRQCHPADRGGHVPGPSASPWPTCWPPGWCRPGRRTPHMPQPHHLFRHHAGGIS